MAWYGRARALRLLNLFEAPGIYPSEKRRSSRETEFPHTALRCSSAKGDHEHGCSGGKRESKAEYDAAKACAERTATLRGHSARIHRVMLAIIAGRKLMPA